MNQATADLPKDVDACHAIIAAQAAQLRSRDTLIDKLKAQLAVLKRARFGASSEKIEHAIAQLELSLEDIEAASAEAAFSVPAVRSDDAPKARPTRQPLPDHLPRHEIVHETTGCTCPTCGGEDFLKAGTAVSEMLDYVPASFRVLRHVQPRLICKGCDSEITAAMPSPPIGRGKPSPGLLALSERLSLTINVRSCAYRKILRSLAALSPIGDLCARRRRPCPFHVREHLL